MDEVSQSEAELAWLIYDLRDSDNQKQLVHTRTVYTRFKNALDKITTAEPGDVQEFLDSLQERLDEKHAVGNESDSAAAPDAPSLQDIVDNGG